MRAVKSWTPAEDAVLLESITAPEAAAILGRSVKSVHGRRHRLRDVMVEVEDAEPIGWPVPEMGLFDSLACVRLRNWARDVEPAVNLTWRIAA